MRKGMPPWVTARRMVAAVLVAGCTPSAAGEPAAGGAVHVPSRGVAVDLPAVEAFYGTRPRYERPLPESGLKGVTGVGSLSAQACRACHPQMYEEWRTSVHAQAWIDPQFQAEIGKSDNRWLCLNCHTPLLVQQDRWPRGLIGGDVERPILTDNPAFDATLRDEGITCTACHVQDGMVAGPGVATSGPHPVALDPRFRTGELCMDCHQAQATYEGKSFVCVFDTGAEWRRGPYDDEGETCVTCHMPEVRRPAGVGGTPRTVRRHWWRGAGIPKVDGRYPPPEANPPGLGLEVSQQGDRVVVRYGNARAGHRLPTGDPERWVQIDVAFEGADGAVVGAPAQLRIGQVWEWTTPPRKVSDNRLAPREWRTHAAAIPPGTSRVRVTASSHRISKANAEYHGLTDYPRAVRTHEEVLVVRR